MIHSETPPPDSEAMGDELPIWNKTTNRSPICGWEVGVSQAVDDPDPVTVLAIVGSTAVGYAVEDTALLSRWLVEP